MDQLLNLVMELNIGYFEGKLHRVDGPAVEYYDGSKQWYFEDKFHRVDGPAVEYVDGSKEWYINNKQVFHVHKVINLITKENNIILQK